MAILIARPVTEFLSDEDRNRRASKSIAYHALCIFVQDCKDFVLKAVTTEINRQKRDVSEDIVTFAETREAALKKWMKTPNPLAWDVKNSNDSSKGCGYLILALAETPEAISLSLPEAEESLTYKLIAEHLISTVKKPTPKAPFSKNGFFMSTLPLALTEIKRVSRLPEPDKPSDSYLAALLAVVMMHMKIDFIPWHHPRTPGQTGPAPHVITHQRWMYINRSSSNLRTHKTTKNATPEERAQEVAESISVLHPSATWSVPKYLVDMGPFWKKAVLPVDWDLTHASLDALEDKRPEADYIFEVYEWVRDNIDPKNWKHHMAVIWAILFTAILPHVRTPTEAKAAISSHKSKEELTKAIRNLPWVKFGGKTHKGVTDRSPYITMVSVFLISVMEPKSPLRRRFEDGKPLGPIWSDKHSRSPADQQINDLMCFCDQRQKGSMLRWLSALGLRLPRSTRFLQTRNTT